MRAVEMSRQNGPKLDPSGSDAEIDTGELVHEELR
jgi:hypothetical protein